MSQHINHMMHELLEGLHAQYRFQINLGVWRTLGAKTSEGIAQ